MKKPNIFKVGAFGAHKLPLNIKQAFDLSNRLMKASKKVGRLEAERPATADLNKAFVSMLRAQRAVMEAICAQSQDSPN